MTLSELLGHDILIYLTGGRRLTGKLLSADPLTIRGPGGASWVRGQRLNSTRMHKDNKDISLTEILFKKTNNIEKTPVIPVQVCAAPPNPTKPDPEGVCYTCHKSGPVRSVGTQWLCATCAPNEVPE